MLRALSANSLCFNRCSGSSPLIYYLEKAGAWCQPSRRCSLLIPLLPPSLALHNSFSFPNPLASPRALRSGHRGKIWILPLPFSPLLLPISHFGTALTEKERGIFIAHTALCILSSAFVFPRYTCVYPQPFLQAEMLIWRPTWKV